MTIRNLIPSTANTLSKAAAKPRFVKRPGGYILDTVTGWAVACADVNELDTATADRVSDIIIDALHREFGPRRSVKPEDQS